MRIEKNTICYISEIGHNNFWYPSIYKAMIRENCEAEKMSWVSGGTKIPIKVLKSFLIPIAITSDTIFNIFPPTQNNYTIVWIEKCSKN